MRVEQCYSWPRERAGPRNGSFRPRTICCFSPWKSYRQSWQFGFSIQFEQIWTDIMTYYHQALISPFQLLFAVAKSAFSRRLPPSNSEVGELRGRVRVLCSLSLDRYLVKSGEQVGIASGGLICASRDQWLQLFFINLNELDQFLKPGRSAYPAYPMPMRISASWDFFWQQDAAFIFQHLRRQLVEFVPSGWSIVLIVFFDCLISLGRRFPQVSETIQVLGFRCNEGNLANVVHQLTWNTK